MKTSLRIMQRHYTYFNKVKNNIIPTVEEYITISNTRTYDCQSAIVSAQSAAVIRIYSLYLLVSGRSINDESSDWGGGDVVAQYKYAV